MVNRKKKSVMSSSKKTKKLSKDTIASLRRIDEMDVDDELLYDNRVDDIYDDDNNSAYSDEESQYEPRSNEKSMNGSSAIKEKRHYKVNRKMIIDDNDMDIQEEPNEEEEDDFMLPCRGPEQEEIENYIRSGLETTGSYSSLYIGGMPGTGKTASVTHTINKLKRESEKDKIPKFNVIYINGMKITNPNNVYKLLYDEIYIDRKSIGAKKSLSLLEDYFKNKKSDTRVSLNYIGGVHLVLVIDEIDCLVNKKQALLYNLFNWTTYSNSRLIIIAISNTLNLQSKLSPKIASRMGNKTLNFSPYVTEQLTEILSTKVNISQFSDDAIKMSSSKVAVLNGDLRRMLQICKRAEEIFESERRNNVTNKPKKVEIVHIQKACYDLFDSKMVFAIKQLKLYEKLVLIAIMFEINISGETRVSLLRLYDRQKFFCVKFGDDDIRKYSLTFDEFKIVIYNLVRLNIFKFTEANNENFLSNRVYTNFHRDEFDNAFYEDTVFKKLIDEHLNK
jgi:Cdc6-like AAA superfamily ATPase